jgi:hypothetical protein
MLNYGDWWGERIHNWGDLEYDAPYGFVLEYLRGGSGKWFRLGLESSWHLADVDTCHYHDDPQRQGRQYLHSLGHVGDYFPDGYLPGAIAGEHMEWSHTWVEGLVLYALLTGERRLWEVVNRTLDALAGPELDDYDYTNCRESGWALRHLVGAYQATGDLRFLNGARIIVDRVLERQRPTGGWERLLVPEHCNHVPPRHMGEAGFMVGVLLSALKRFHQITHDPAVGASIVAGARWLVSNMWVREAGMFRYTSCPDSPLLSIFNIMILEGLGYAWRLSGEVELYEVFGAALATVLSGLGTLGVDGKNLSKHMRSLCFILDELDASPGAGPTG